MSHGKHAGFTTWLIPILPQVQLKGRGEDSASYTFRGTAVLALGCAPPLLVRSPSGFVHRLASTKCWFSNLEEGRRRRKAKHTVPWSLCLSSSPQSLSLRVSVPLCSHPPVSPSFSLSYFFYSSCKCEAEAIAQSWGQHCSCSYRLEAAFMTCQREA